MCVLRIHLDDGPYDVALGGETQPAKGWHSLERSAECDWRWTDGQGALPWATRTITIELRPGCYWQSDAASDATPLQKVG